MTRKTLKLPPTAKREPTAPPSTARGKQALRERHRTAPVVPVAPPPEPKAQAPAPRKPKPKPDSKRDFRPRPKAGSTPKREFKPRSKDGAAPEREFKPRSKPPAASQPRPSFDSTPRPPRPPIAPRDPDADPRLSKRMSELGLCSRREADEWIENGWVRVDGQVVKELGVRISREARIEIDPAAAKHQGEQVTILLHKPVGYVSGQPEDGHQSAVVLVKPENHWTEDPSPIRFRPSHLRGLAPAGRLDIDSTGLLVYTQDGRVARRLIGADSEVEKEYLVRVEGTLPDGGLERLRHGLELDGVKLKPAKVSWSNEDQLRFVLREGRKRQIRRMCELVGLKVTGLKRVRSGGVPLGPLPLGQWRYLGRGERF